MNILITSVGRRTRLVELFQKELNGLGKVIVTDCSPLAPALYIADKYYIVPRIDEDEYLNTIKLICQQEKVNAIISLIDPELSLLAKNVDEFEKVGTTVIVSPFNACEIWLDKFQSSEFCLKHGFLYPKTYSCLYEFQKSNESDEIQFPVFIKPRKGSASLNIQKANSIDELNILWKSNEDMIIQNFIDGQEFGVDVYVDLLSREVISIFIKEKISMRSGETDKARSIISNKLYAVISRLVTSAGLIGPIDVDVFEVNGEYYISEINPRFGGGYPLAYECGVNFPKYILNNLNGITNEPEIGRYDEDIYMLKHEAIIVQNSVNVRRCLNNVKV